MWTDEKRDKIKAIVKKEIDDIFNEVENENNYTKLKKYMENIRLAILYLLLKTGNLEEELKKIKTEVFENELNAEDIREILSIDYKED